VPVSPIWLVLLGILSVQFGAGLAKTLFDEVAPTTIVWLRLVASALVLLAIARPSLRGRSRQDWLVVLAFGLALGLMNWSIYQSFARIPIGLAVTIEFVGPLTLAVLGSRRAGRAGRGARAARAPAAAGHGLRGGRQRRRDPVRHNLHRAGPGLTAQEILTELFTDSLQTGDAGSLGSD
jgi:uncharacterized membrane protein YhaH (DUF805 family)